MAYRILDALQLRGQRADVLVVDVAGVVDLPDVHRLAHADVERRGAQPEALDHARRRLLVRAMHAKEHEQEVGRQSMTLRQAQRQEDSRGCC